MIKNKPTDEEPKSRHPVFLFVFTNRFFLLAIALSWAMFSALLNVKKSDWLWFARSGSVTVIVGAILTCRNVIRLTRTERIRFRHMSLVEQFSNDEKNDQERDSSAVILGACAMLTGTLVWAYGDLLPNLWR